MPVSTAAKLASHIWRGAAQSAANAAHTSASTLRSAFQGTASSTTGAAGSSSGTASSWTSGLSGSGSSAGAGTGGAKYHAGRNAHFTYQSSGRAISQASSSSNNDSNNGRSDDDDEARRHKAYQLRLRAQKGSPLRGSAGPPNLTTIQMQARFRHAFAANRGQMLITSGETESSPGVHSFSTQATANLADGAEDASTTTMHTGIAQLTPQEDRADFENPAGWSSDAQAPKGKRPADAIYRQLMQAIRRNDSEAIRSHVSAFRALPKNEQTLSGFNMAMEALLSVTKTGALTRDITNIYSQLIENGLSPNSRTFSVVLRALCARDVEVQQKLISKARLAAAAANSGEGAVQATKVEAKALDKLQREDDYQQAIQLFNVAHQSNHGLPDANPYNALLRSCAVRGDVDRAIGVLDMLERSRYASADGQTFKHLIRTFTHDPQVLPDESSQDAAARKLLACKQVFQEFREASKGPDWDHDSDAAVWRELIAASFRLGDPSGAVALFEEIVGGSGQSDSHVPPADSPMVSAMLRGFLGSGDLPTALDWFSKIVSANQDGGRMALPDPHTLELLMAPLSEQPDLLPVLNQVSDAYAKVSKGRGWKVGLDVVAGVVNTNCRAAEELLSSEHADKEKADEYLDRAMEFVSEIYPRYMDHLKKRFEPSERPDDTRFCLLSLCTLSELLVRTGRVVDAGSVMTYSVIFLDKTKWKNGTLDTDLWNRVLAISRALFAIDGKPPAARSALHLVAAAEFMAPVLRRADVLDETYAAGLVQLYRQACSEEDANAVVRLPLTSKGWSMLLDAYCFEEAHLRPRDPEAFHRDGIPRLLDDLGRLPQKASHADPNSRPTLDVSVALDLAEKRYGTQALAAFKPWAFDKVAAKMQAADSPEVTESEASSVQYSESSRASSTFTRDTSPSDGPAPLQRDDLPSAAVESAGYTFPDVQVIDTDLGHYLTDLNKAGFSRYTPQDAYRRLQKELQVGNFAHPEGLAALIGAFGRAGNTERIHELYAMAQHVLHALGGDPSWQRNAWFHVEDAMISAFSHAGNVDAATVHRHRIIAAGGAPSASAYAALIATIRDTTDDASIAQELFDESRRFGITPSAYLFNTVISKLSRARKADRALQLFDEMTINHRIRPTSVTYGAVINACTRIGDEQRAVQLFARMEDDPSFKPRVPPYNTMMQFYVQTLQDREKALVYYNKMVEAGVAPSSHTYKLMLDLYGAIEPVMPDELESTFEQIVQDPSVKVQGTHWASLIICYGSMLGDLDKAVATFESIASHPSTVASGSRLPDAVSFEALLAVFVNRDRPDLVRTHFAKMVGSGIKMTAYIANLLIRSYSIEGPEGLNEARQIFESMSEPAAGVAALGNHTPRAHGAGAPVPPEQQRPQQQSQQSATTDSALATAGTSPFAAVHREPSTYETMIRAELHHGNRDKASQLLERMEHRAFPPALLVRAAMLISEAQAPTDSAATGAASTVFDPLPSKHSWVRQSPRSGNVGLPGSAHSLHTAHGPGPAASVRHASTAAGSANAPGTSNPAPGPPKPNSPFTIFDRPTKTTQKDRAAVRKADDADESTRGAASRQTDYVRHAIAESLADRVADIKRDYPTIVELGSGAGFLRHHLDPEATGTKRIIMCDTSEAMLKRDEHLDSTFPFEFERRVIDEESLPFEEASLDCVVVSGGLHWTNDLPGVLIQIRKALKPDGVFLAGLCGGDTLFELRTSLQLAEQEREGGISARVSPMADQRDMASLLQRAGFTIPTVDVDEVSIGYPSMFELMSDLRDMGESNAVINRRPHLRRDTMLAASAIYSSLHGIQEHAEGEGEGEGEVEGVVSEAEGVPATFSLIFLIGWAPSESQPKPLKRGSAKHSLKDVLAGPEGDVQKKVEEEMEREEQQRLIKSFTMSINETGGSGGGKGKK
ncbi:uncharacterized protein PFL1_06665 [Pseudozyma flocculosa PF-1]|uniref:Methyltransferase type 11 domain-containing protein n=2 Tax=Pseudozyma flocculosa TaxID=84751 RepID=A0A5C3F813_9BASI|nr:uncharacterized protein PFL1_06665 [Pseudozyma flocculosa PF-1]EPQ25798.1 hypothetical protein PFL1_06665 [Pseudozyma flocculosa PF-1]SPO40502.1 uncharacterized protein PSFLO_05984 [Pseudozyma flocculosa]